MPNVIFPSGLCFDTPVTPVVTGCQDAARATWEVLEKPTGSSVVISDTSTVTPEIQVSQDGEYKFKMCCYFERGVVIANAASEPSLSCPRGAIAGQIARVKINGCLNGTLENAVAGGVATGVTFDEQGLGSVTTDANSSGAASVSVDCVVYDEDGNPTRTSFSCAFDVYPSDSEVTYTTAPATQVEFITCGEVCECVEVTVVFDCGETPCTSAQFGVVFRDCPDNVQAEDCEPVEFQSLIGVERALIGGCDDLIDCCDEQYCCEEDQPALFWNNLCTCPGWTLSAPAVEGSSVYNACGCSVGQSWCFEGEATIVFQGPPRLVDTLIIWGHNISSGSVSVSPLQTISGSTADINLVSDDACMEGYTVPVVMNFTDPSEFPNPPVDDLVVEDVTVTITSNDGGLVCIDQIFLGQKFFLPYDALPESFVNPHDGTDYELEVKRTSCGLLSTSVKHVPIEMSFDIEDASSQWIKEKWRPYLRYAQSYGVLFQHSRNNCPNDVFNGILKGPVGPSRYVALNRNIVTLTAEGFITQNQPRLVLP